MGINECRKISGAPEHSLCRQRVGCNGTGTVRFLATVILSLPALNSFASFHGGSAMTTTTKTSPLASKASTRSANNSLVWSRLKIAFPSMCPRCGRERRQHGYSRRTLFFSLNTGRSIDAYCVVCNVCWALSESERHAISSSMNAATQMHGAGPATSQRSELHVANKRIDRNQAESQRSLQRASVVLRAIRQRYETGRSVHPHACGYSVHFAVKAGDIGWITAAIESIERAIAGSASEAAGPPPQASSDRRRLSFSCT